MQSFLIILCTAEIVTLIVGTVVALASPGSGDAAGRAMGGAYLVIGVIALLLFFVVPALLLARSGHVLWLAAILSGIAAIPALVLGIGSVAAAAQSVWKRLRHR
jgi:hypothetical protein